MSILAIEYTAEPEAIEPFKGGSAGASIKRRFDVGKDVAWHRTTSANLAPPHYIRRSSF
ncbi:hypothetical protein [Paraburkholderia diazotrophica]|uniref:hypothetical protein n=1 Tax=Paraburkholderia diazotrophica TaxID=667676 RepID=UPI0015A572DB|nr:hypothetical protein [Paraburkholderia diazotrophica]